LAGRRDSACGRSRCRRSNCGRAVCVRRRRAGILAKLEVADLIDREAGGGLVPPPMARCLVAACLEVWLPDGAQLVSLDVDRVTIGRLESNEVSLPSGDEASRAHAVIERLPSRWCLRDLSLRNGTFANGERIAGH